MVPSPPFKPSSPTAPKEFVEKWLQALTLSVSTPAAQRVKPLLSDIDQLCKDHPESERESAALRLWEYGNQEGMTSLLSITPNRQQHRTFDGEDSFHYERVSPEKTNLPSTWMDSLGLKPMKEQWIAEATSSDWTNLLRKEIVNHGRALNMTAIPEGSRVRIGCEARWDTQGWTIQFENPSWLKIHYEGRYRVERPGWKEIEDDLICAMTDAESRHRSKQKVDLQFQEAPQSWITSIDKLQSFHEQVLIAGRTTWSPWYRRAWSAVWPVIYREQNKLKGPCDLQWLRTELASCFQNVPSLTLWMFVFGKLICEMQTGTGLGLSGDFRDQ